MINNLINENKKEMHTDSVPVLTVRKEIATQLLCLLSIQIVKISNSCTTNAPYSVPSPLLKGEGEEGERLREREIERECRDGMVNRLKCKWRVTGTYQQIYKHKQKEI